MIHEPFAVINADDFYGAESYRVLAQHLASATPEYAMVGFPLDNTLSEFGPVSRGLCRIDAAGFLKEIVELKRSNAMETMPSAPKPMARRHSCPAARSCR